MVMKKKIVLNKSYDPIPVEDRWARYWVEERVFTPRMPSPEQRFSMVLPPP